MPSDWVDLSVNMQGRNESVHVSRVKDVQKRLRELGYRTSTNDNGKYSGNLSEEVIVFQRKAGLQETGIVDWQTYARLMASDAPRAN